MKRYLIIGGNGFIGQNLVSKMSIDNKIVVGDILNSASDYNENVEYKYLDFLNTNDFAPYLESVDAVIHLVSTVFPQDGTDRIEAEMVSEIFPTIRLLESMVKSKVKEILFASSGGTVYGIKDKIPLHENEVLLPICKYGVYKLILEKYLHLYNHYHGINYKIARISNPYGVTRNAEREQGAIPIFINKISKNESVSIWGDGSNLRDYIYITDVVDAIISVLSYNGDQRVFNIGSGEGYSLNQIVEIIAELIGIESPKIEHKVARLCDVPWNVLDCSLLRNCTGWEPNYGIKGGIAETIKEMSRYGQKYD